MIVVVSVSQTTFGATVAVPALGALLTVMVTSVVALAQGVVPVTVYLKVLVLEAVVMFPGVKVPAAAKAPSVPVNLVQDPPVASPVSKEYKSITVVVSVSQ